jgi:hypothetical protein
MTTPTDRQIREALIAERLVNAGAGDQETCIGLAKDLMDAAAELRVKPIAVITWTGDSPPHPWTVAHFAAWVRRWKLAQTKELL